MGNKYSNIQQLFHLSINFNFIESKQAQMIGIFFHLAFSFSLFSFLLANAALNVNEIEDDLVRKTSENSSLKGKIDYSENGKNVGGKEHLEVEELVPLKTSGEETIKNVPNNNQDKSVDEQKLPIARSMPNDEFGQLSANESSSLIAANKNSNVAAEGNNQSNGQRVFNLVRVRQCVGWCLATLPPWYSDLAKVNCERKNACEKAPGNEADCGQRCDGIIKNLPIRPVLSCQYFCDLAYGGLEKTIQFCKSKCPPS